MRVDAEVLDFMEVDFSETKVIQVSVMVEVGVMLIMVDSARKHIVVATTATNDFQEVGTYVGTLLTKNSEKKKIIYT